ncbi:MAG TPA: cation:proton antiporter [Candidatus Nanoarchaeia archaeon]|nr:cation:proton antiporter [Candidatus Nanoarchaeia archaeon]
MIDVSGNVFLEVGIIIIIAAVAAYLLRLIKQPQILAYFLVGILITPVLKIVTDVSIIESMSVIGVAFLLFLVGLEMDIKSLKTVALVSSLGGFIQITLLFVFGYLISLVMGFLGTEAIYIGLMLAFSSTMVVMKILSDRRELNTLHGRLTLGILLTEDIVAILALLVLDSVNNFNLALLGFSFLKFGAMFVGAYILSKFVFPPIFRFAAKNQELLLISSLATCFLFSLAYHYLGFSVAIGAFIAGIILGTLEYNFEIIGRVKSLKDFFALIFFVSLGMGVSIGVIKEMWVPLVVLVLLIMVLKPIIVMTVCSIFQYTKKPAFLAANSLAQIGEFSLIIVAQGLAWGHISQELFSLTVIIAIITITLTSYYIEYNQLFYNLLSKPLSIFDRFTTKGLEFLPTKISPKIILCGHNRVGYSILKSLNKVKKKVLVVDYNPEVISSMIKQGYHCIYGEITDEEIIERMNLRKISILISTVTGLNENLYLIRKVREVNSKAKIFVTASNIEEALKFYKNKADYVILPHFLGGEHASQMINDLRKRKIKLKEQRERHILDLEERRGLRNQIPR